MITETAPFAQIDSGILRAHPALHLDLSALANDPGFTSSVSKMKWDVVGKHFTDLTQHLTRYNNYNRRETRLWALKMGTGSIPPDLENKFKATVPEAIDSFQSAFKSLDNCLSSFEQAGMHEVLERHSDSFTSRYALDETNVFGHMTMNYFRHVGFSTPMIDDFTHKFQPTHFEFIKNVSGGKWSNLHTITNQSVEARIEVLKYTQQHGFDYIRGGSPPDWAIKAVGILGTVIGAVIGGITGAWIAVGIVVASQIAVALICADGGLSATICDKIGHLKTPIFNF